MKLFKGIILLLISFITVCSVQAKDVNSIDTDFRKKLVGVWLVEHKSPRLTANGEVNLISDGTFNTWTNLISKGKIIKSIRYKGFWEVNNGILIETITEANDPKAVGKVTKDKILRVDDKEFEWKSSSGSINIRKRKVKNTPGKINKSRLTRHST